MPLAVLIVDPDLEAQRALEAEVRALGHDVVTLGSNHEALSEIACRSYHLVFVDTSNQACSPGSLELIQAVSRHDRVALVIALGAEPSVETVIACVRSGAVDFMTKPLVRTEIEQAIFRASSFYE